MDSPSKLKSSLQNLESEEFETLVASVWSEMGWSTEVTPSSRDKGIDIIATKSGVISEKVVIQAKCYSAGNKVGRPEIQQYNTLQQQKTDVDSVIVVTSSSFTSEAKTIAKDLNVKMVNGTELAEVLPEHLPNENILNEDQENTTGQNQSSRRFKFQNGSNSQQIFVGDLSAPEEQLHDIYLEYLKSLKKQRGRVKKESRLIFDIDSGYRETSEYVVYGGIHQIKFPAPSEKLLGRFLQTAKKYGWDVHHVETYGTKESGLELSVPPKEANMFYVVFDISPDEPPRPTIQARVTNLILDTVYEQSLSGTQIIDNGSIHLKETPKYVIE